MAGKDRPFLGCGSGRWRDGAAQAVWPKLTHLEGWCQVVQRNSGRRFVAESQQIHREGFSALIVRQRQTDKLEPATPQVPLPATASHRGPPPTPSPTEIIVVSAGLSDPVPVQAAQPHSRQSLLPT